MHFKTQSGINLHYQIVGDGPLLVLCHGLVTGNIATWYFSIAQHLAQKFKVLMFDMRGHGQSSQITTGYDLATLSNDLLELVCEMTHESDRKVHLVGHSYGGLMAMQFALSHAERLHSLTVVDAPMPAAKYIYPSLAGLGEQTRFDGFIQDICRQLGISGKRKLEKLISRADTLINHTSLLKDLAECQQFSSTELTQLSEQLNTFEVPINLIYGRYSPCREAGAVIKDPIKGAHLHELSCGHYIPSEAPQALRDLLVTILVNKGSRHE